MERKAAFQLSLGFIIAVVFAIVLLSLSLTWLRGMIENIMGITDDLTQEAQTSLRDAFRGGAASSFAVWPSQYNLPPGKGLRMSAGIENDAIDGRDHQFVINIVPVSASDNVLTTKKCDIESFRNCQLYDELKKWVTFDRTAGVVQINAVGFKYIEVRPTANAVKGTYLFNIVSCYDEVVSSTPTSSGCLQTSENLWGGSAQQLLISVI